MTARDFDIVVYGASGFTGKYVCQEIASHYNNQGLKWAIAGRDETKLKCTLKLTSHNYIFQFSIALLHRTHLIIKFNFICFIHMFV